MNISESIQNQIKAGFTKDEIINNLKQQGFTEQEVNEATEHLGTVPALEAIDLNPSTKKESNGKSILMGIIFIGLGVTRLAGMRGGGGEFNLILGLALTIFGIVRLVQGFMGK